MRSAEMGIIRRIYMIVPAKEVVAVDQPMDSQLGCKTNKNPKPKIWSVRIACLKIGLEAFYSLFSDSFYTSLKALYDPKTQAEPFLETIERRGDNGKATLNLDDAGCRHLSFYNLPDQLNSMCFFSQNVFTGTKYIQNLIEQMDQARISRDKQGVGVSFLDATPNIAIEATFSEGFFSLTLIGEF